MIKPSQVGFVSSMAVSLGTENNHLYGNIMTFTGKPGDDALINCSFLSIISIPDELKTSLCFYIVISIGFLKS